MMSEDDSAECDDAPFSYVALIHAIACDDGISVDVLDMKGKMIQYSIREPDLQA